MLKTLGTFLGLDWSCRFMMEEDVDDLEELGAAERPFLIG